MRTERFIILILVLMLSRSSILAQENDIGINFGYGKSAIGHYNNSIITPFDSNLPNYIRFGFRYSFKPKRTTFNINTGLNYDYKGDNERKLNFLRLPINIEFAFGQQVQFIMGTGLYLSYLLGYDIPYNSNGFDNSKNSLQLGLQGNIGVGINLSPKYIIQLVFQQNLDLTSIYESHGDNYNIDEKGHDGFINVCLKYNISKK